MSHGADDPDVTSTGQPHGPQHPMIVGVLFLLVGFLLAAGWVRWGLPMIRERRVWAAVLSNGRDVGFRQALAPCALLAIYGGIALLAGSR